MDDAGRSRVDPREVALSTVLVVEPHDDTRDMLMEFFRSEGLEVLTATTTDDALPLADGADVVVTALNFGGRILGVEFVRALRRRGCVGQIVAYTTCTLPRVEQEARAAGCDAFVVKPCE